VAKLVLMLLHGGGGSANAQLEYTAAIDAAERFGFVLVVPNGWHPRFSSHLLTWNAGTFQLLSEYSRATTALPTSLTHSLTTFTDVQCAVVMTMLMVVLVV
jgi:hypothetical protein